MDMGLTEFADWLVKKRKAQGYDTRRGFAKAIKQNKELQKKGLTISLSTLNSIENGDLYPSHDVFRTLSAFFGDVYPEELQRIVYPDDFRPGTTSDVQLSPKMRFVVEELSKLPDETLDLFLSLARQLKSSTDMNKSNKKV